MADTNSTESNIFGTITSSGGVAISEPISNETTAAGKLIDHLKFVADQAISQAEDRTEWLARAANAGQNGSPASIVQHELNQPADLKRADALAAWTLPSLTPLALPAIPDSLKVDFGKLQADAAADVVALQTSWMAKYLPDTTDVSALNGLFTNILSGTNAETVKGQLASLAASTATNLKGVTDPLLAALLDAIALMKANLAASFTNAQTNLQSALTIATNNTAAIAWARARDKAALEGARQEAEAVNTWASRGLSLPGGPLIAIQQKARQATQIAAADMAGAQAEKAQQMYLDIAKATVDAWLRDMEAQANAEIQGFRAISEMRMRAAELALDADKFIAKQAFDNLGLTLDFTKFAGDLAVKYRLGVEDAVNNLIHAYATLRGNEQGYLDSIARSQRDAQAAITDFYRAAMAAAEIGMKVDVQNSDNALRWASIAASFIGTAVGHHVTAASSAADVYARVASMSLSGLNGIASVVTST